jgi:N-acyl-L-homoserine lactone synthetase
MLIHVVTVANSEAYAGVLSQMHADRWRFYIEERGWKELRAKQTREGHEADEFDDRHTHYLIGFDESGGIAVSARFRRTDDLSLLGDILPDLVDPSAPLDRGADVWEMTRVMVARPFRKDVGRPLRMRLHTAAVELALSRGVRKFIGSSDTFLLPNLRAIYGAKYRVIGLPRPYDGGELVGVEIDVDADLLHAMREKQGALGLVPSMIEMPATSVGLCLDPQAFAARFASRQVPATAPLPQAA